MTQIFKVVDALPAPQNPTQKYLQEEINRLKTISYDLVLAIGGGSVLDTAKLFAVIAKQEKTDLNDYIDKPFPKLNSAVPLIAVPTTSGTGSEVTPYASLETLDKKKITIGHASLYPTIAIIDPELTYSMPEYVTACTGFDALSQAIESFWSIHATPFSRTHALRAIELIHTNLDQAWKSGNNAEARSAMALGSCEAGLAIAHTKTTAVHSVSYPITAHFSIAHGHACALTLSSFVRFNAPVLKEEGRPLLKIFGEENYDSMANKIDRMMDKIKLERKLSALGINEQGVEIILRDGFRPDRIKNNPRPVNREELSIILKSIL